MSAVTGRVTLQPLSLRELRMIAGTAAAERRRVRAYATACGVDAAITAVGRLAMYEAEAGPDLQPDARRFARLCAHARLRAAGLELRRLQAEADRSGGPEPTQTR